MSLIDVKKKLLMAQKGGADVSELFNISLWTGTGAARTITTGIDSGEGSLVWIKNRNGTFDHVLFDSLRGATNYLSSNTTSASASDPISLTSFNSSGYGLGGSNVVNAFFTGTDTYVGWQFRRAEKFFDIVQYTGNGVSGRQIAHNLGVVPGMVVIKRLDSATGWFVSHRSYSSAGDYQRLETTDPVNNVSGIFGTHSSSIFSIGNNAVVNASGGTYIAYLFAHDPSPEGLIQCGSYVGSGAAGNNINLGWRPQYLMIKNASNAANWHVFDAARGLAGPSNGWLYPNLSSVEDVLATSSSIASNANGFQLNAGGNALNASGNTYVYMAIREAA